MKFYTFRIKKYKGIAIRVLWIKVELITLKRKFNFKIEITNWDD